jgi:hypothetical protein
MTALKTKRSYYNDATTCSCGHKEEADRWFQAYLELAKMTRRLQASLAKRNTTNDVEAEFAK